MRAELLEQLQARRVALVASRDALMALPDAERRGPRGSLKQWEKSLRDSDKLIETMDAAIAKGVSKAVRTATNQSMPRETVAAVDFVLVAQIYKSSFAELRVTLQTWEGRRTVDLRVWMLPKEGGDYVPSRKGVAFATGKLDDVIAGLTAARQHVHPAT